MCFLSIKKIENREHILKNEGEKLIEDYYFSFYVVSQVRLKKYFIG